MAKYWMLSNGKQTTDEKKLAFILLIGALAAIGWSKYSKIGNTLETADIMSFIDAGI